MNVNTINSVDTVTRINGVDEEKYTDSQLDGLIEHTEGEINDLMKRESSSKLVDRKIKEKQDLVDQVAEILNERLEEDDD